MVSKRQLNVYLYIVFLRGIVYTERLSIDGMNYTVLSPYELTSIMRYTIYQRLSKRHKLVLSYTG